MRTLVLTEAEYKYLTDSLDDLLCPTSYLGERWHEVDRPITEVLNLCKVYAKLANLEKDE